MRLVTLFMSTTVSAVLLSGCSFIGGQAGSYQNPFAKQKAAQNGQYQGYHQAQSRQNCQIFSPQQPIPQGCRPEQVTLGVAPQTPQFRGLQGGQAGYGGFPQQPNFGEAEYTSGAYGTAVGQTPALAHHTGAVKKRKPKLRGSFSLGIERSVDGDLIDYDNFSIDAVGLYDPQVFNEGSTTGSNATGNLVRQTTTANVSRQHIGGFTTERGDQYFADTGVPLDVERSNISYGDAWSTPIGVKGGLEYVLNNRTTFFANAGYSESKGNDTNGASVNATLYDVTQTRVYDVIPGTPPVAATDTTPAVAGTAAQFTNVDTVVSAFFVPNQEIAKFAYQFSDLERIDLEAGARHYFNPLLKSEGYRTVTPFVGASAGASHYNKAEVSVTQEQRYYGRAFDLGGEAATDADPTQFYDVTDPTTASVEIFDDQWVPAGQVNVGAEWQVTPVTAIAFETGVRVQGGRKYSNGSRADTNVSVPVTLRGSFNF